MGFNLCYFSSIPNLQLKHGSNKGENEEVKKGHHPFCATAVAGSDFLSSLAALN